MCLCTQQQLLVGALLLLLLLLQLCDVATSKHLAAPSRTRRSKRTGDTSFRCFGAKPGRRGCLFNHLYFQLSSETFYLVGVDPKLSPAILEEVDLAPHFTLKAQQAAPDASSVQHRSGLTVLWGILHTANYSFGHALVHVLFPMYFVLRELLGDSVPNRISVLNTDNTGIPKVFQELCVPCRGRLREWSALRTAAQESGKDWLHFQSVVLGGRGIVEMAKGLQYNDDPPHGSFFNDATWWAFREWMFSSSGLDPDFRPRRTRIVINAKGRDTWSGNATDRRRILNPEELQQHLQKQFPQAEVAAVNFVDRPMVDQFALLANTSVFITTEGSSGFRHVFLPRGGAAVVLGHPDNVTAGAKRHGAHFQFHELYKYFSLSYVRFVLYPVDEEQEDEYEVVGKRDMYTLYNAHIRVDLPRMERLVRGALAYQLPGRQQQEQQQQEQEQGSDSPS